MELLIDNYGYSLGKTSERVVVKNKGQVIQEVPFFQLKEITINSKGVSLSTDVIQECMLHGIPIYFMDHAGMPYANIISPNLNGTVQSRRQQLLAYNDERGLHLAKSFIIGKIKNQINTLKYYAKYRKISDRFIYERLTLLVNDMEQLLKQVELIKGANIDEVRGVLLNMEGRAAQHYWQGFKELIHEKLEFPGRMHQGAKDPVNSMLNYGYAILGNRINFAISLAGLDPYGGFFHVDRSGRLSLVYDLIEEFRQAVVDRTIISLINKGTEIKVDDEGLTKDTRKLLSEKINERMNSTDKYEGRRHKLQQIIVRQSRRMAVYLRGEGNYKPFIGGW
ncbi:MAG: CRISPR-associated endonuclease Cas1 [Desulfitobacterium hafniense]|nr:CRISPR-associated endonuclease Cas1 [Desulfitobacterium hafniense]